MKLVTSVLFAAAALLSTQNSLAGENWVMVKESDDGVRLLVESEGFTQTVDNGIALIAAKFRTIEADNKNNIPVAFVTRVESCNNLNGELFARSWSETNKRWETITTYWWSGDGRKLYDAAGVTLCRILAVRIKEAESKKINTKKKDQSNV